MRNKVKILYISPVGERGGAEIVLLNIGKYCNRDAFEPVVCFLKPGPFIEEVSQLGIRTFLFPTGRFRQLGRSLQAIRFIRTLIKREGISLVFGNMAMGHLYGGLAALGTRAKVVWFQHGIVTHPDLVDRLVQWVPSNHTYANSHATAAGQFAGRRRRCEVIFPGVDLERFAKDHYPYGATRAEFGIPSCAPLVVNVARFQKGKGQEILLEAASLIHRRGVEAHFIVVGDTLAGLEPDYRKMILKKAEDLGLEKVVHFAGFRNDLPRLLRDADLLAHSPILPEGFGLVLVEAMAMELPVVASRGWGPDEIVVEGETGYLVPPGDPHTLAERMVDVLANPERREAMGKAGRRRAEELFSARQMIARFEQSFERVLADGAR